MVSAMSGPTKWAVEPVSPDLGVIEDACSDENLLRRALIDFTTAFARHIVADKTPREALAELDCWRNWFETVRRTSHGPV
jgi:hypothetical protein